MSTKGKIKLFLSCAHSTPTVRRSLLCCNFFVFSGAVFFTDGPRFAWLASIHYPRWIWFHGGDWFDCVWI